MGQDFKFAVSDARKIARSLSAFANRSGGRLLIGVKDNGVVAGVRNDEDVYVVECAAERYCVPPQPIRVDAFIAEGGHKVVRVEIDAAPHRPVMVDEGGGQLRAYWRVADENIAASPLMVRAWKARESESGMLLTLDGTERRILDLVTESPREVEEIMLAVHLSRSRAEDVIVKLFCAAVIDFTHQGDKIKICSICG